MDINAHSYFNYMSMIPTQIYTVAIKMLSKKAEYYILQKMLKMTFYTYIYYN